MKKLQWGHNVLYQLLKRLLLCFFQKLHSLGQVKMRLISQLIKVISKVHQKLLSYFNGKAIFCIYNACIVIFILKCWFEFELFGICYIIIWLISVINLQKFWIIFNIITSRSFLLSTCVLFVSVMQSVNEAQFLNILDYWFDLFVLMPTLLPLQQQLCFL